MGGLLQSTLVYVIILSMKHKGVNKRMAQTWTISDKNYVMLAQFTNEDSDFISNDEHFISVDTPSSYYQFDCLINHDLAKHMVVGNHVILKDKEGFIHDFTIRKTTPNINNVRMTVYAENGGMDLNNESAQPFTAPSEQKSLEWYLTQSGQPLYDSPIQLGLNELSNLKRVISNDSKDTKLLQRLITTVNAFDGGEYRLHAKLANNNTTLPVLNLQLDIVKKLGSDISQTFLIDDYNLKELTNETSIIDLITAVFPRGKELDNGTTVDISSIVYDDGTYYTTQGSQYIKNRKAHSEWSYSRFSNDERWGYILGNFNYDTESPQELFNRALTYLKEHDSPTVAFSASGREMNAKLGDTIMIATHKTPEPTYLKARVLQMKVSYVDDNKTEYILGNYAIQPSMVSQELLNLRNQIQDNKSNYVWLRYADDREGNGISEYPEGKSYLGIAYNMRTPEPSNNPDDYNWSLIKGNNGTDGTNGVGVQTSNVQYALGDSGTTAPTTAWTTTIPTLQDNKYLWTRTIIYYTNGTNTVSYSVSKKGDKGEQGIQGAKGADGRSLYTWLKYADDANGNGMSETPEGKKYIGLAYNKTVSTESSNPSDYTWSLIQGENGVKGEDGKTYYTWVKYADTATGGGLSDNPTGKKYIGLAYNKTTTTESTNPSDYTWALIKGDKGDKGDKGATGATGATGNGISSTNVSYGVSTSGTTPPTSWGSTVPTVSSGQFLWTRTILTYTNGTTSTAYSVGKMGEKGATGATGATGAKGDTGATGATGNGVSSTVVNYGVSTSGTTQPTSWGSSIPSVPNGQFLWTRTVMNYTNGTSTTFFSVAKMGETGARGTMGIAYLQPTAPTGTIENGSTWFKTVSSSDRRITSVYHYLSGAWVQNQFTQDAINVNSLSALSATLGNVTAGTITGSVFTNTFNRSYTSTLNRTGTTKLSDGKLRIDYHDVNKSTGATSANGSYMEYSESGINFAENDGTATGKRLELNSNRLALGSSSGALYADPTKVQLSGNGYFQMQPKYFLGSSGDTNYQKLSWTVDGFELRPVDINGNARSDNTGIEIAGNNSYVDFKVPYTSTADFNSRIILYQNQEFEVQHAVANKIFRLRNIGQGGEVHVVSQYSNVNLMCNYGVNVRNPSNSSWKAVSASGFSQQSDEKWKYKIKDVPSRLEQFKNLDFKAYRLWTENGKYQEGVIANDNIELPFISKGYDGYSVDTYAYTTFIGKATQEYIVQTDNTIDELRNENTELKTKITDLESELETIKQQLSTLLNN